ncbi:hypothetical protein G6F56_012711 [Rhizopus delemar]|nr:hypothetical protein G6F56_012711 [Rhizopus delemar]
MQQAFKRRRGDFNQAINTSNQQLQLEAIAPILSSKEIHDSIRSNINGSGENDEDEEPTSTIEESLNETNNMVDGDEYEANEPDNDEDDFNSIDEVNNYLENHLNKVDQPLKVLFLYFCFTFILLSLYLHLPFSLSIPLLSL